jgi:hypothetical protein
MLGNEVREMTKIEACTAQLKLRPFEPYNAERLKADSMMRRASRETR